MKYMAAGWLIIGILGYGLSLFKSVRIKKGIHQIKVRQHVKMPECSFKRNITFIIRPVSIKATIP